MNNVAKVFRCVRQMLALGLVLLVGAGEARAFPFWSGSSKIAVTPVADSVSGAEPSAESGGAGVTLTTTPTNTDSGTKTTESPVGSEQKPEDLANLSTQDAISLLRNGNSGEALNVRQLAAINNLIKRMDYISQIEKKMNEMSASLGNPLPLNNPTPSPVVPPGGASASPMGSPGGSPLPNDLGSSPSASSYNVLRVNGAHGDYSALISNGSTQMRVKQGDDTAIGRIASVSLDGVTVVTSAGTVPLSFSAPAQLSGVTTTTMGR